MEFPKDRQLFSPSDITGRLVAHVDVRKFFVVFSW